MVLVVMITLSSLQLFRHPSMLHIQELLQARKGYLQIFDLVPETPINK